MMLTVSKAEQNVNSILISKKIHEEISNKRRR